MSFAQRSKGETHKESSKRLEKGIRPMLLHCANVRRAHFITGAWRAYGSMSGHEMRLHDPTATHAVS